MFNGGFLSSSGNVCIICDGDNVGGGGNVWRVYDIASSVGGESILLVTAVAMCEYL